VGNSDGGIFCTLQNPEGPNPERYSSCLKDKGPLLYMELMVLSKVTNTGRLNYHLKVMGGLIRKQEDGRYILTERGYLAVQLLNEFPEKPFQMNGQKRKSKKLLVTAALLLIGIIAASALLVLTQPTPPSVSITYWKQQPDQISNNSDIQFLFNATVTKESFQLASSDAINYALAPYINRYPFVVMSGADKTLYPLWTSTYVHKGQFVFSLFLQSPLNETQLISLTQDLKQAFESIT